MLREVKASRLQVTLQVIFRARLWTPNVSFQCHHFSSLGTLLPKPVWGFLAQRSVWYPLQKSTLSKFQVPGRMLAYRGPERCVFAQICSGLVDTLHTSPGKGRLEKGRSRCFWLASLIFKKRKDYMDYLFSNILRISMCNFLQTNEDFLWKGWGGICQFTFQQQHEHFLEKMYRL